MPSQGEYVPRVGEEVLVTNHLGFFLVEEIDLQAKTAVLRVLRSNTTMKDVAWNTIWPLDKTAREILERARDRLRTLRAELIRKLVLNLHVNVAERQFLGFVYEDEVAEAIRAILDEQGAFPRPRQGPIVHEGQVITTGTGRPEITWERPHLLNLTIVAERRRESFADLDSAIRAYIESEWPRGIDGIAIQRRR